MYKLITSDLDESLLKSDKTISKQDLKAIKGLKNCKFAINTGRAYYAMGNYLKVLGTDNTPGEYTISFNGGVIIENKDNKIIYKKGLSYPQIKKVFDIGLQHNYSMEIFTAYHYYLYNPIPSEIEINKAYDLRILEEPSLEFLKGEEFIKLMYVSDDNSCFRSLRKKLNLEDEYTISFSSGRYMEFNHLGVNKGNGLKNLCDILHIDIKDAIFLGDNDNDLSAIKAAGLGVAVNNATEEVKKNCDVILKADNNHNPMSEIINRFIND